jgi:hypothetical protein
MIRSMFRSANTVTVSAGLRGIGLLAHVYRVEQGRMG